MDADQAKQQFPEQYNKLATRFRTCYYKMREKLTSEKFELENQIKETYKQSTVYARGTVYHSGREHRSIKLGEEWHEIYQNTEIESWSATGRFD